MKIANRVLTGVLAVAMTAGATFSAIPVMAESTDDYSSQYASLMDESVTYKDGTYTGTAKGFNGNITVEVTIEDGVITKIEITEHNESEYMGVVYIDKASTVIDDILEAQSADVDAISGATITANGIINAVKNALENALEVVESYISLTTERVAYISGYDDGTVEPDSPLKRSEAAKILYSLIDEEDKDDTFEADFTDVEKSDWYYQAVAYMQSHGIINGYDDGTFLPDKYISRAELVKIISQFSELEEGTADFDDLDDHWAIAFINSVYSKGIINGYDDGTFRPDNNISRAETVKIINALLNRAEDKTADIENPFKDLEKSHWAYYMILEAAAL